MEGWISLHRKIIDHWIWKNDKYLKGWVWFLMRANHKGNKILINSNVIELKRGEFITSINNICIATGMTHQQTRTFLSTLEKDKMINKQSNTQSTKITILNYDGYNQEQQTNNKPTTNQQQTSNKPTTTDNNVYNDNNVNNVKEKYEILFNKLFSKIEIPEDYKKVILLWLKYKSEKGQTYKETGMKTLINGILKKYSSSDNLKKDVEYSMSNNYSGIFESKNQSVKEKYKNDYDTDYTDTL